MLEGGESHGSGHSIPDPGGASTHPVPLPQEDSWDHLSNCIVILRTFNFI